MTEAEQRNLAIITEVCDAFNNHDIDGILRHFTNDAVWLVSRGVPPEGGRALPGVSGFTEATSRRAASLAVSLALLRFATRARSTLRASTSAVNGAATA